MTSYNQVSTGFKIKMREQPILTGDFRECHLEELTDFQRSRKDFQAVGTLRGKAGRCGSSQGWKGGSGIESFQGLECQPMECTLFFSYVFLLIKFNGVTLVFNIM